MFLFLPKIEMANWHTTSATVVAGGELGEWADNFILVPSQRYGWKLALFTTNNRTSQLKHSITN